MSTSARTIEKMASKRVAARQKSVTLDDPIFGVSITNLPADRNVSRGGGCGEPRHTVNARREFEEELADFNIEFGLAVEVGPLLRDVKGLTHRQAEVLTSMILDGDGDAKVTAPEDAVMSVAYAMEHLF